MGDRAGSREVVGQRKSLKLKVLELYGSFGPPAVISSVYLYAVLDDWHDDLSRKFSEFIRFVSETPAH